MITGCLLDLVNAIACVGTAVTLFPVTKRHNEALALGFEASRLYEMAVIMIGIVASWRLSHSDSRAAVTRWSGSGQSLVAIRTKTFLLGPGLAPGFNALLLGYFPCGRDWYHAGCRSSSGRRSPHHHHLGHCQGVRALTNS